MPEKGVAWEARKELLFFHVCDGKKKIMRENPSPFVIYDHKNIREAKRF